MVKNHQTNHNQALVDDEDASNSCNTGDSHRVKRCLTFSIIFVGMILIVLASLMIILGYSQRLSFIGTDYRIVDLKCNHSCNFTLVESIPDNLTYPSDSVLSPAIYENWMDLIDSAQHSIDIASFYWTLLGKDVVPDPSDWQGEAIFKALLDAGKERKIKIRIVQSKPTYSMPDKNTQTLEKEGAAEVRSLDFNRLMGGGVLHTKMWIVDESQVFVGSPNMDWRALTQVKELGAVIRDCPCLAEDAGKIFSVYWQLAANDSTVVPPKWPKELATRFNKDTPMEININQTRTQIYLSSSPPSFCPQGRTSDIDSIIDVIDRAQRSISIAVMDYFPISLYSKNTTFWPRIDNCLRRAAIERGVHVRLLTGYWNSTRPIMINFLKSLSALNSTKYRVETKLFVVPTFTEAQSKIPFSRVAHNKYMVTDQHVYIGTSNWSEDYFTNTAGVGLILDQSDHGNNQNDSQPLVEQLQAVFDRDWFSEYAKLPSEI